MFTLLREGGVPIIAVLIFGILTLFSAFRHLKSPGSLRSIFTWMGATGFATCSGVAADLAAVGHHISERYDEYRPELIPLLLQGLAESMAPAIVGFSFLALSCFVLGLAPQEEP